MTALTTIPLDAEAFDGKFQIVTRADREFACVRWHLGAWRYSADRKLDFEPTHYHPNEVVHG